jgi:phage shock protein C
MADLDCGGKMKRLYKSRKNKVIAGVCGGIAEYFDVDPVLIRIIAILFFFTGGAAFIAYIVGLIIIPNQPLEDFFKENKNPIVTPPIPEQQTSSASSAFVTGESGNTGKLIIGIILIAFGVIFLLNQLPFFAPGFWWLWGLSWRIFWPSVLIIIGLVVLLLHARK